MRLWIDYMAPCDVHFFKSVLQGLDTIDTSKLIRTARCHAETCSLLSSQGIDVKVIGNHHVENPARQAHSVLDRMARLTIGVPKFDVSLSLANIEAVVATRLRFRPSISVVDNDLVEYGRTLSEAIAAKVHSKADYVIAPASYPLHLTATKRGNDNGLFEFDGFKEDIYLADHIPDERIRNEIPFKEFIVVRPEALYSTYVHNKRSIVGEILTRLSDEGINVVYLPRHPGDRLFVPKGTRSERIWAPKSAMNGLDLVYFSNGVLTGSGTFAREAACVGQLAVSFFPDRLLAVDQELIKENRMFHSTSPSEIVEYVVTSMNEPRRLSNERSIRVKKGFMTILKGIIREECQ